MAESDPDIDWISQVLWQNKNKTFVDRLFNPDKYPRIDLGDGNYATHKMAWMRVGDKYHVYPTILWNGKDLVQYDPKTAYEHARKSGNYIEFGSPAEADIFSRNYKRALGWE